MGEIERTEGYRRHGLSFKEKASGGWLPERGQGKGEYRRRKRKTVGGKRSGPLPFTKRGNQNWNLR